MTAPHTPTGPTAEPTEQVDDQPLPGPSVTAVLWVFVAGVVIVPGICFTAAQKNIAWAVMLLLLSPALVLVALVMAVVRSVRIARRKRQS